MKKRDIVYCIECDAWQTPGIASNRSAFQQGWCCLAPKHIRTKKSHYCMSGNKIYDIDGNPIVRSESDSPKM